LSLSSKKCKVLTAQICHLNYEYWRSTK